MPLIGSSAIQGLQLVAVVQELSSEKVDPKTEYPGLFFGLERLENEYKVTLHESAKPFALSSPRRILIPLYQKQGTK